MYQSLLEKYKNMQKEKNKNSKIIQKKFKKNKIDGTLLPIFYARDKDDLGIGDIYSLFKAVDLKRELKQNVLEILPLNFSSAFESPYSVLSTKCFNTIYISHFLLSKKISCIKAKQFLNNNSEKIKKLKISSKVNYQEVRKLKISLFQIYFDYFCETKKYKKLKLKLGIFKKKNKKWLEDHLLYILLRKKFLQMDPQKGWDFRTWPKDIKLRKKNEIEKQKKYFRKELDFEIFLQWIFYEQWSALKKHAKSSKVALMGDIPFSVDGADLWLYPSIFGLSKPDYKRKFSQGVPPDIFSDFGQYWQFYAYDWDHPKTIPFLMDRFKWNQDLFSIVRLDHVLGYYRGYLFYEDPDEKMTFNNLGVFEEITDLIYQGHTHPEIQGDNAWKIYKIFIDAVKNNKDLFKGLIDKNYFNENKPYALQDSNMLLIARQETNCNHTSFWTKQYCVEKAVHFNMPKWEFLKISQDKGLQNHHALVAYLFGHGDSAPKPSDSLRPCFFRPAPGEKLMKMFLNQAQKQKTIVISEALGVVPQFVTESMNNIEAINYIPLIYGLTPNDPNNLYFPENHLENAFVTFALHDSETLVSWWMSKNDEEKQLILNYTFSNNQELSKNYHHMHYKLQEAILSQVYKSKAFIKVLLWTDIFLSTNEDAINKPGQQMGQWVARMPLNANLDDLMKAVKLKKTTIEAKNAINLIKNLKNHLN